MSFVYGKDKDSREYILVNEFQIPTPARKFLRRNKYVIT